MTSSVDEEPAEAERLVEAEPVSPPPGERPGASTFTIEGRSAPALFVIGWLASLIGLGAVIVALLGGANPAAPLLLVGGLVILSIGLVAGAGSQGIERRVRAAAYPGPSPFLVFAASVPISLLAAGLIAVPITLVGGSLEGPTGALLSVLVQALVYVGLIRLLVVDTGALSWTAMRLHPPSGRALTELAAGALWAGPVILLTIPVAAILSQLVPVTPVSPLPPSGQISGLLLNLVAGAIIAPVGEELLFRGFATTAWARTLGPRRALIRGALFFAFVHVLTISGSTAGEALGLAIVGFASRIPVAIALDWLFLRRESIWAPIGLHATFNGVLILIGELAARAAS